MITGYLLNKVKKFRGLQVPDTQAAAWGCSSSLAQAWRRPGGRRAAGAQALKLAESRQPVVGGQLDKPTSMGYYRTKKKVELLC